MIFKRLSLICSLIFFIESCSNSDLNGSFQLSATTDTTKASIGDLISYKIITHNIKDNYFEISQSDQIKLAAFILQFFMTSKFGAKFSLTCRSKYH